MGFFGKFKKKAIYKIIGAVLLSIYITIVIIGQTSGVFSNLSGVVKTLMVVIVDLCFIGGIIFLIFGFKKDKKDKRFEMTEETAQSIIKKTEKIKNIALILVIVGVALFLLGYFNKNVTKIGVILWMVGIYIWIFAKERKKYKLSIKFINDSIEKEEKEKKEEKEIEPSVQTTETSQILNERFQGLVSINDDRNQIICDKFIAKGIVEFENGSFDENTLDELTFDEFCHIYSTIGWFVEKAAPNLKESAISYKIFLRKKLLKRLSAFPVYTINAKVTGLPYVKQDSSLLLYTNKKIAELTVSNSGIDWIEIFEITPQCFNTVFCEYFCTGYKAVNINGETIVKIEDVYETKPTDTYGNICVESCVRMIDYKQTLAMFNSKAKAENRNLNEDEIKHLNRQSYAVSVSLLENTLCLPAEFGNELSQNINIVFPLVCFENGQKFIGLFTDQGALNRYYRKSVSCVVLPDLIRDQYNKIKNDNSICGILINPGREEYMMTKEMLTQLFDSCTVDLK